MRTDRSIVKRSAGTPGLWTAVKWFISPITFIIINKIIQHFVKFSKRYK